MDWTALGALGQLAAAVAVLITLIYLAQQVRQSNRQDLLSAFRHTYDSLNEWALSVIGSGEVPAIILRGRGSYKGLSDVDRLRSDHIPFVFLNIPEPHFYQVQKTAMDDDYRKWAKDNLAVLVHGYFNYPGTRDFCSNVQQYYQPEIRKLIADSVGDA